MLGTGQPQLIHMMICQAVIERQLIRAEEEDKKNSKELEELLYLEVAKMVVIIVSLVSV